MAQQQSRNPAQQETTTPVQVQKFLGGLDYPVGKQQIIDKARQQCADEAVLAALAQIADRDYDSPVAVSREIGKTH